MTGAVDWIGNYWVAADGVRSIDLNAAGGGGVEMDFRTSVGQTYTVTFAMAGNPAGGPAEKAVRVSAAGQSEEFTFDVTGRSTQDMGWQDRSFTFTADATTTTLGFVSLIPGIYGPALDNVRISKGEGR